MVDDGSIKLCLTNPWYLCSSLAGGNVCHLNCGVIIVRIVIHECVYRQVTEQDKDLLMATKDIIREDSRREKCKANYFLL